MDPLASPRVSPAAPDPDAPLSVAAPALVPLASSPAHREPPTLAALFEAEESGLLRFAIGLVGRRAIAEELVQETFLRLHQIWSQVEHPRGWLYRSLRNLALNHLRDQKPTDELDPERQPTASAADANAHERLAPDALGRMEATGMIRLLLAELSDEDRELIQLKYHNDLKYREISARTGLTVGYVGYRLHHLLKGLADGLRRAGIESSRG